MITATIHQQLLEWNDPTAFTLLALTGPEIQLLGDGLGLGRDGVLGLGAGGAWSSNRTPLFLDVWALTLRRQWRPQSLSLNTDPVCTLPLFAATPY